MAETELTWRQINIRCADWQEAERTCVHRLGPALHAAESAGLVHGWWFVRKGDCWRLRLQVDQGQAMSAEVTRLCEDDAVCSAVEVIYEPEIHAFGGPLGM